MSIFLKYYSIYYSTSVQSCVNAVRIRRIPVTSVFAIVRGTPTKRSIFSHKNACTLRSGTSACTLALDPSCTVDALRPNALRSIHYRKHMVLWVKHYYGNTLLLLSDADYIHRHHFSHTQMYYNQNRKLGTQANRRNHRRQVYIYGTLHRSAKPSRPL